jgi:hypothetical protein
MKQLIPRKFERKRLVGEVLVRRLPDGPTQSGQVLDLGQSGLSMYVSQCLPTGQLVEVVFRVSRDANQVGLVQHTGRVVRSRAHPDGNVLGLVFAQPLTDDEFTLLETRWVRS